jgi:hypothetical protein
MQGAVNGRKADVYAKIFSPLIDLGRRKMFALGEILDDLSNDLLGFTVLWGATSDLFLGHEVLPLQKHTLQFMHKWSKIASLLRSLLDLAMGAFISSW